MRYATGAREDQPEINNLRRGTGKGFGGQHSYHKNGNPGGRWGPAAGVQGVMG